MDALWSGRRDRAKREGKYMQANDWRMQIRGSTKRAEVSIEWGWPTSTCHPEAKKPHRLSVLPLGLGFYTWLQVGHAKHELPDADYSATRGMAPPQVNARMNER